MHKSCCEVQDEATTTSQNRRGMNSDCRKKLDQTLLAMTVQDGAVRESKRTAHDI